MSIIKHSLKQIIICLTAAICIGVSAMAISGTASAQTLGKPVLYQPVSTLQGVKVSWAKNLGAPKYRVFIKRAGKWQKLADTDTNEYLHRSVVSGTRYTYTVRCLSADGKRFLSDYRTEGKSVQFIAAPQIKSLSKTTNGVKVTWGAVRGAAKYRLMVRTAGNTWKKLIDTKATSFTHTGPVSGTTYRYIVRCLNDDARTYTSGYRDEYPITFVKAPVISGFTDGFSGTRIKWIKCAGAAKYRVYVRNGASWTAIGDTAENSFTWFPGNNTTQTYTVRCLNASGKAVSAYDTVGKSHRYSYFGDLQTPAIRTVSNRRNGVKIEWDPVEGAEKYRVLLLQNGQWKTLANTKAAEYLHTGAVPGETYTYSVCCIADSGKSYTSCYDPDGFTNTYVKAPVMKSVVNTVTGPLISWDRCAGAEKYRLTVDDGSGWKKLTDTTENEYVHSSAVDGTQYAYRVYCLDLNGRVVNEIPSDTMDVICTRDVDLSVYTQKGFAADIAEVYPSADVSISARNAPLTRASAAGIIVRTLGYQARTAITISDANGNTDLQTAAYYSYFLPDEGDRIYPDQYVTAEEYDRLITEFSRYAKLSGKRILAFGDSIMYGMGNKGKGIAVMLGEKYGMSVASYAKNGATFGTRNTTRYHISDQIVKAHYDGCRADIILLNGATNDISMVYKRSPDDIFDPEEPASSTMAYGINLSMEYIRRYWPGVPVLYVRVHDIDRCTQRLEMQMAGYAANIAKRNGAEIADVFNDTGFDTAIADIRDRYTADPKSSGRADSVHPNALGYATFYLPLISDMVSGILIP